MNEIAKLIHDLYEGIEHYKVMTNDLRDPDTTRCEVTHCDEAYAELKEENERLKARIDELVTECNASYEECKKLKAYADECPYLDEVKALRKVAEAAREINTANCERNTATNLRFDHGKMLRHVLAELDRVKDAN